MSVKYTPPDFDYVQVRLPEFSKTPWGLDTASVMWVGPAPKLQSFVEGLRQGTILPAFSGFHSAYGSMFLTSWSDGSDQHFPPVTLQYAGLRNGALPDVIVSSEISSGSGSQTSDDSEPADQRTWSVSFISPVAKYRYITDRRPATSRYGYGTPVLGPTNRSSVIVDGNGRRRSGAAGLTFTPVGALQSFTVNPVEGTPFFECEESWIGTYQEIS